MLDFDIIDLDVLERITKILHRCGHKELYLYTHSNAHYIWVICKGCSGTANKTDLMCLPLDAESKFILKCLSASGKVYTCSGAGLAGKNISFKTQKGLVKYLDKIDPPLESIPIDPMSRFAKLLDE